MSKNEEKKKDQQKKDDKIGAVGVIGIVLCVLLVPILLMNVTMIVKGLVNPSQVPTFGGYAPLIVLTDSMYPDIKSGDLIIVKSLDAEDVQEGDVIAFFDPDGSGTSVLTHRVVEITEEDGALAFRTKGDANNAEDPTLAPAGNLIGIYKTKISGAGDVAMFLQSTPGLVVCVAVPLVLLIAFEVIRRRKYEKNKNDDTKALLAELEALRAKQAESEKKDAPKSEEPKSEEPKAEEPKPEEPKTEEPKTEEPKAEEPKAEEPKAEEPKEEPKAEEPKAEKEEPPAEGEKKED